MLDTIRRCDQVTWILCTKRPQNFDSRMKAALDKVDASGSWRPTHPIFRWLGGSPPKNVILLASVESPDYKRRIAELLRIPAVCHGLSVEPLLADMRFDPHELLGLKWLIVGCESGPKRRYQTEYEAAARSIIQVSRAAGVEVFHKQMPVNGKVSHEPSDWPEDLRVQEWPSL